MSVKVAILKEIRKAMRRLSNREVTRLEFLGQMHKLVCELEKEAYEALQDVKRQKPS